MVCIDGMRIIQLLTLEILMERKWLLSLMASSIISIGLFLLATLSIGASSDKAQSSSFQLFSSRQSLEMYMDSPIAEVPSFELPSPPSLAYLISGTKGDGRRMKRTLQALYHPRNQYVLHLDLEAPSRERIELARYVKSETIFLEADNVHMIGKANLVTYRGPTMIACTLHAAAILLRRSKDWDWFINLSASDYPLVTQDDLLHVLSYLPRDLSFIEHTNDIGWKEFQRVKPIIMDPGLYMSEKSDLFWVQQKRVMPTSFKLFTGSAWMALSRPFTEYCIWGWDNLPRTLLMYYTNFISSPEGYFHTVICNSRQFRNTMINHDLHYIAWDNPPKQHPLSLGLAEFHNMTESGAPFARKFAKDDPVLDKIDQEILGRGRDRLTPGGWCLGSTEDGKDPCLVLGDPSIIKPGLGAKRLENLILKLLAPNVFHSSQCVP